MAQAGRAVFGDRDRLTPAAAPGRPANAAVWAALASFTSCGVCEQWSRIILGYLAPCLLRRLCNASRTREGGGGGKGATDTGATRTGDASGRGPTFCRSSSRSCSRSASRITSSTEPLTTHITARDRERLW